MKNNSLGEMPMGFSMALAQNPNAFEVFSNMSSAERQAVIDGTHSISSKQEMRAYVENMTNRNIL